MKKSTIFSTKSLSVVLFLILFSFALSSVSYGFLRGDIDMDEKIGLPEALYALQTLAGFHVTGPTNTLNVPDDVATIERPDASGNNWAHSAPSGSGKSDKGSSA